VKTQHLSDEAVAAYADGVLGGTARDRAGRHVRECAECNTAVRIQREAVAALRAAPAPPLPSSLAARLRSVPLTTPITTLPTAVGPDGSTMLATFGAAAAFVPQTSGMFGRRQDRSAGRHHGKPMALTAAAVALAGALTAGSVAHAGAGGSGPGHAARGGHAGQQTGPQVIDDFQQVRARRP
jgi:hypothetical protein